MNLVKSKKSDQSQVIYFIAFFVFLIFFDIIDFLGRYYAPETISHFSCSVLPFAKMSSLFIPQQLVVFSDRQCAHQLNEPAVSIIFFMLKIAAVSIIGIAIASWIFVLPPILFPPSIQKVRAVQLAKLLDNINNSGGLINNLQQYGVTLLLLVLFCGVLLFKYDKSPAYFRTDIFAKLFEDWLCVFIYLTVMFFVRYALMAVFYALKNLTLIK